MSIVAAVQMASGPGVGANLHEVDRLIARAADGGATLVVLPENFAQAIDQACGEYHTGTTGEREQWFR